MTSKHRLVTAANLQSLCLVWQRLQLSKIPRHIYMEHDRLKDVCTWCRYVYNTKDYIEHHVYKHHASFAVDLCLVWLMPQQQRHHL